MVNEALHKFGNSARTFLGRLRCDRAGNVLAMAAACMPPILILIGGGVDMSRAYMTQTSLQNACDAGVLAGRRAQAKSGTWTSAEQGKATRMFNFNFQGTAAGANANSTVFTPTNPGGGVIAGTATTVVPTTLMKIFGTNTFALTANCSAEFQISNIDVMMVLDTTGSMACRTDGTNCNSDSNSKIEGLKTAIRSFYTTVATAIPSGGTTRVRFGFVPYNGTVNIKNLVAAGDIPTSYLTDSTAYQTKLANFNTASYAGTPGSAKSNTETYASDITSADCNSYGTNNYPANGRNPSTSGTMPGNVTTITYSYRSWTKTGTSGKGFNKVDIGTCVRNTSTVVTTYAIDGYTFTDWRYSQSSVDTSRLKTLAATTFASPDSITSASKVPSAGRYDMVQLGGLSGTSGFTTTPVTWSGCIEERSTVNTLISALSIPLGATDLDLTTAPTSTATRWRPYVAQLEFDRGQSLPLDTSTSYAQMTEYCPPPAQKFTTVDTATPNTVPTWIENYLATLYAWGGTYHDIGMIWGARLANPSGIMSSNVNSGNLTSVSRHIIFLTDGEMSPYCRAAYSAYGIEALDNRVAPLSALTGTACDNYLIPYQNGRFLAACKKARDEMGYTVWVIGFGQAVTDEMKACAGSDSRAMYAGSTTELQTNFRTIASRIADLRLKS